MNLILQIETATTVCSVALAQDGKVVALKEVNQRNVHAELITIFIEEVLRSAGRNLTDLVAVAVSKGPGSYTGLRIGVSTAKGLCYALDKSLIAVNTLEAMAAEVASEFSNKIDKNILLCPMIDARRMEVYMCLVDTAGQVVEPTAAIIINENTFDHLPASQQIVVFGDGAGKCRDILAMRQNIVFLSDFVNSATQLTIPSLQKFKTGDFENVAYFEPYYLKEFIAGKKAGS